ncbi:MAG: hypothetical protein ACO1Q7_08000 [Gemmatimonas sp.]
MTRLRLLVSSAALIGVTSNTSAAQAADSTVSGAVIPTVARDSSATLSLQSPDLVTNPDTTLYVVALPAALGRRSGTDSALNWQDTTRRKAVTYSDWYSRRLTVHRYASYAMLPLFVGQYILGDRLLDQKEAQYNGTRLTPIDSKLRSRHAAVAGGVGALFLVNTTTGVWNLIESRHTVEGRKLRTLHAITMLVADAGFVTTGYLGSRTVNYGPPRARTHRNVALGSMLVSTAGASMMWFFRD